MKKYQLIVLFLSFTVASFANEYGKRTEIGLSVNAMNMDYREYTGGTIVDSEKSDSLPGFGLQYKQQLNNGSFIDIDYSQYYGNTDYVGSYLGSGGQYGDVTAITENTISDGSIGYSEEKWFDNYLVSMRLGMGYRYWERALGNGHTEEYTWPYGTVKLGITGELTSADTLGIAAEYHHAISPKMKSNKYGTFDLGRTDGFSIIVPWEHALTPSWAVKFTYMYQTWNINKSDKIGIYYEPDSESKFHTVSAALVYRY
ncbi:outer membrane beta-barrel protein [Sulfuricurvum sp.]|uniref:outer membrane beta-barrel protein n=1 Tax=Sulfuricurvum sp. TaxID=2025608 RepID=UPI002D500879|nr:outer membrane beta-barrel protein [Sulfuricurvum sp.]HZF69288.1 outer membrane beta-barrel protein [Sulfuricurvum sp.]